MDVFWAQRGVGSEVRPVDPAMDYPVKMEGFVGSREFSSIIKYLLQVHY
jgi:hypothetical protein